ncbi:MAG: ABC transporter substrate-binding protein [Acidimicrobiia bacterium]|nr:ABC transporter substrate-binding protein [Acidimicrobiia bacterium]
MKRKIRALAGILLLALILAACGSGDTADTTAASEPSDANPTTTAAPVEAMDDCSEVQAMIDATAGMSAEDRTAYLLPLADEAGPISLYTELNGRDTTALADIFDDTYGIDLQVYRAGSEDVRLRVLEEASAGFRGLDLVEIEALDMTILDQEGVLAPASSPHRAGLIEAGIFDNFSADRVTYIVPVWNESIIAEGDIPQSFEDLADERFAGLMALEDSDIYWFAVIVNDLIAQGMTEDEAVGVFQAIAANSSITSGHTTTLELLIAGEYGITPNGYSHRVEQFKLEDAGLEWLPVNAPVVAEITAVGVACNAVNPAGALLLEDFFLDPATTQAFFVEVNRTPSNSDLQAVAFGPGGAGIEPLKGDVAAIVADFEKWTDLWDSVIRSSGG